MPGGKTKFSNAWLDEPDGQSYIFGKWCRKGSEYSGFCILCKKDIPCSNAGILQLKQHALGKKHKELMNSVFHKSQTKFRTASASTSGGTSQFQLFSHADKVSKAEIIWALKVAQSDFSFASSDNIVATFQEMFGTSISKDMTLSSSKLSYLISDGLGPYFRSEMVKDVKSSGFGFTVGYDETPNAQVHNQLDIHIRYWTETKGEVVDRYLKTVMLGHGYASTISSAIISALEENNLLLSKCVALSSDGPNVSKAVWKTINQTLIETNNHGLVDISTCNLHVVHNSFGKGLEVYGNQIEELAVDIFFWFKSAARREDYSTIQSSLQLEEHAFFKHVDCRWLSLLPVVDRLLEQYDGLKTYFMDLPKKDSKVESNVRYIRIRKKLQVKDTYIQMCFLQSVTPLFQGFLTLFQREGPLIHLLYYSMSDIVSRIMARFIKQDVFAGKDGVDLVAIDVSSFTNQLPDASMEVGEPTRRELGKLTTERRKVPLSSMRKFYVTVVAYLLKKLPFQNTLLKDLSCLHPSMQKEATCVGAVRRISKKLPHVITEEEISLITDEWKIYQEADIPLSWSEESYEDETNSVRVDHYWRSVFQMKLSTGEVKFNILPKLVKTALALAHGNAHLERGFSANKRTLTSDRTALGAHSLNGLRTIKDALRSKHLNAHEIPITREMLTAARNASKAYKERKEKEDKEREERKKTAAAAKNEAEETTQMLKQACKQKDDFKNKDETLKKREELCMSSMNVAEKMFAEAGQKLSMAIERKDFTQMSIAQAMLDSARVKMESAKQKLEELSKEKLKVDGQKRKLIDNLTTYSKSAKKTTRP